MRAFHSLRSSLAKHLDGFRLLRLAKQVFLSVSICGALAGNAQSAESSPPELERACPGAANADKSTWAVPEVSAPAHRFDIGLPWLPADNPSIRITAWRTLCPGSATRQRAWLRFSAPTSTGWFELPRITVVQNNRVIGRFTTPTLNYFRISNDVILPVTTGPLTSRISGALINDNQAESFDPAAPFSLLLNQRGFELELQSVRVDIPGADVPGNIGFMPSTIAGHWWNPSRPGSGLILARNERETLFAAWMTFDDEGRTTWFVMPEGLPTAGGTIEGSAYSPRGPAYPFNGTFNPTQGSRLGLPVGTFSFRFIGATQAEFVWSVNGIRRVETIEQIVINPLNETSDAGIWLSAFASGWGVGISGRVSEFRDHVHTTLLTYAANGEPVWYFAALADSGRFQLLGNAFFSGAPVIAPVKYGALYRPTGPAFGRALQPSAFQIGDPVGFLESIPIGLVGATGGASIAREKKFIYTINGQRMELDIQPFRFEY